MSQLPRLHFGRIDESPVPVDDDDDEEPDVTPANVLIVLGFDPADDDPPLGPSRQREEEPQ